MIWFVTHDLPPHTHPENVLGFIADFLDEGDPRPAAEQIRERYIGGWTPTPGFSFDVDTAKLSFPGDPDMLPLMMTMLHGTEFLLLYPMSFMLILQPDDSFEVDRLD